MGHFLWLMALVSCLGLQCDHYRRGIISGSACKALCDQRTLTLQRCLSTSPAYQVHKQAHGAHTRTYTSTHMLTPTYADEHVRKHTHTTHAHTHSHIYSASISKRTTPRAIIKSVFIYINIMRTGRMQGGAYYMNLSGYTCCKDTE